MKDKKWYESRTVWANVIAVLGGVALAISGELAIGAPLTVAGVVNIILRVVTKQGVTL